MEQSSLCTLSKSTHCVSRGADDWQTNRNEEPVGQWSIGYGPSYYLSPAVKSLRANRDQAEMSEMRKVKVRKYNSILKRIGRYFDFEKIPNFVKFLRNNVKIVVSIVYWLMEIKLQIVCLISFSGETIRSNYTNNKIYLFLQRRPRILNCVASSIARRCWCRFFNR